MQFIGTFFNAFQANFCLLSGLVCTAAGTRATAPALALVLVTGLGHCLLPFPVRGAAYANIFNMIAFLYFDLMCLCVTHSLQSANGSGRGLHMLLI